MKYNQMSSKKLEALLAKGVTEEERVEIENVLNARKSVTTPNLSQEDAQVVADAEGAKTQEPKKKAKKTIMTDEQRVALAAELRANTVNHKCEVVPFDSLEWVNGVVVSIIEEKRTNKVMYAVKTDDGRRIVKAYGSQLIRISDEIVEPVKKMRSNRKSQLDKEGNSVEKTEWTEEDIEVAIKEVIGNVGKTVSFPEAGKYGEVAENAPTITGRIVSLVPNKRSSTILYKIQIDKTDENEEKKYSYKVTSNPNLVIAESLDEDGQKLNERFVSRRYKEVVEKVVMSPEEAFKVAEASLNKAKEALEKAQALVEKRQAKYESAKEAYENSLKNEDDIM